MLAQKFGDRCGFGSIGNKFGACTGGFGSGDLSNTENNFGTGSGFGDLLNAENGFVFGAPTATKPNSFGFGFGAPTTTKKFSFSDSPVNTADPFNTKNSFGVTTNNKLSFGVPTNTSNVKSVFDPTNPIYHPNKFSPDVTNNWPNSSPKKNTITIDLNPVTEEHFPKLSVTNKSSNNQTILSKKSLHNYKIQRKNKLRRYNKLIANIKSLNDKRIILFDDITFFNHCVTKTEKLKSIKERHQMEIDQLNQLLI